MAAFPIRYHEPPPGTPLAQRRETGVALAACLAAAVVYTWPLLPRFFTHLAGDPGDPYALLWSMLVFRDELLALDNPFFTDRAFHSEGVSLVFQTANWPGALLAVPLWSFLPEISVWNAVVLFEFFLTGLGMFLLARELTASLAAALFAGLVLPVVPYHMAHAGGHIHLLALGWLPLYLWRLHRAIADPTVRNGALAGAFLALAGLAAFYHLVFAAVLTVAVLVRAFAAGEIARTRGTLRAAGALAAVFAVLCGPLLIAMLAQSAREPIYGAHEVERFSLDLEAFFVPNQVSAWAAPDGLWRRWSGNGSETVGYLGYAVLALAAAGAWSSGRARAYLAAAAVGALLALGPHLRLGGTLTAIPGPYALLADLPGFRLSGVPARLACVTYIGLVGAAAFGVARLVGAAARRGRAAAVAACAAATLVPIVEYWPRPNPSSRDPAPAPLRRWADAANRFAVLDVTGEYRMHWHALLHRQSLTGGAPSRYPFRVGGGYWSRPVVREIERGPGSWGSGVERVDPAIDFDWGHGSPMAGAMSPDDIRVEWRGTIEAPRGGEYRFVLGSDDGAVLSIDRQTVVAIPGSHPYAEAEGRIGLEAGKHAIAVDYEELGGAAAVRLFWEGPGMPRQVVAAEALTAPNGERGLTGRYAPWIRAAGLSREAGRAALRALGVRYVLAPAPNVACERSYQLPLEYSGDGVFIYRVPPDDATPAP